MQAERREQLPVGDEPQGFGRDGQRIVLFEREDRHVGCQPRFEFQFGVVGRDDHLVGHDARFGRRFEADLLHHPLEGVVGVGVDGELHPLSVGYLPDVGFVDIGHDLHLRQVVGNGEERRCLEARRHGLPLLHGAADDHAVDRGGDRRVAQIAFDLDDGGLGLFVGVARLLVEVEGFVVFGVAYQLLLVEGARARVLLHAVFVFGLAARQLGLRRFQFGLQGHLVHFGDELSGFHHVVVVDVEPVDDPRYLRTHLHFGDRFHRSRSRDRVADRDAARRSRFQRDSGLLRRTQREPEAAGRDEGRDEDGRAFSFHLHVLFVCFQRSFSISGGAIVPDRCRAA